MVASAEKFEHLIDRGILLDERVVGGMQSVSEQIAAELGAEVVPPCHPRACLQWASNGDNTWHRDHLK